MRITLCVMGNATLTFADALHAHQTSTYGTCTCTFIDEARLLRTIDAHACTSRKGNMFPMYLLHWALCIDQLSIVHFNTYTCTCTYMYVQYISIHCQSKMSTYNNPMTMYGASNSCMQLHVSGLPMQPHLGTVLPANSLSAWLIS